MVNTQHLLQRFLCSRVLFSKYTKYAKPAGSKTQGMNVRFKIFKNLSWSRHLSYHKQGSGVNVTLAAHVSATTTTPDLIKAHSSAWEGKGSWAGCVLAFRHTRPPKYEGATGKMWWGPYKQGNLLITCCWYLLLFLYLKKRCWVLLFPTSSPCCLPCLIIPFHKACDSLP